MSNTFFLGGAEIFLGEASPLVTGLWTSIHHKKQAFSFLRTLCAFSILM